MSSFEFNFRLFEWNLEIKQKDNENKKKQSQTNYETIWTVIIQLIRFIIGKLNLFEVWSSKLLLWNWLSYLFKHRMKNLHKKLKKYKSFDD